MQGLQRLPLLGRCDHGPFFLQPTQRFTLSFYLFQCPHTVITIFDRMFRDALESLREQGDSTPIHNISDVALGFRSIFGHLI